MPTVRLVNPHTYRERTQRRERLTEKIGAIVRNSLQSEMRHLRRELEHGEQSLGVESKAADNPADFQKGEQHNMAKKHHHRNPYRRHRRHHNPILAMSTEELLKSLAFAAAGNIVTDLVPGALGLSQSGLMGYAASGVSAVAASYLAGKLAGPGAATSALIGGGLAVLRKVLNDFFPNTILSSGLSGDLGFYINNDFPLPTVGAGPYLLNRGYAGSTPMMNGGVAAPAAVVASNGQPAAAAPALPAAAGGGWRGEGRWAA